MKGKKSIKISKAAVGGVSYKSEIGKESERERKLKRLQNDEQEDAHVSQRACRQTPFWLSLD